MTQTHIVRARVSRRFQASAEEVFDAWLDPELAREWFGPGLGEMTRVEIDASVGGTFWLVQRRGGEVAEHTGEYLEIDRPRRLVFTWRTPPLTDTSRVIIDIRPLENGCELTVTHEMGSEWEPFIERAGAAWGKMADVIASLLGTRQAGHRRS
jgi:uncharacterized protein YndB with AHSA1/START domain